MEVFGDTIHLNDGTHLDGGIADDSDWQRRWWDVVSCDFTLWELPTNNHLGKRFVNALANEWKGVSLRKWNADRPLIFAACVLHRSISVRGAKAIKQTIMHRLDLWEAGRFNALVHELRVDASSGWDNGEKEEWWDDGVSDSVGRKYHNMVLSGKLRAAVRYATNRGQGRSLKPDDLCSKSGKPVLEGEK